MTTYTKTQAASLVSTVGDYTITFTLKNTLNLWYLSATCFGMLVGGLINFLFGRYWVFDGNKHITEQAIRYFLVWIGYLILNAVGVYLATTFLYVNYLHSKIAISLLLSLTYNYLLQKKYVFK